MVNKKLIILLLVFILSFSTITYAEGWYIKIKDARTVGYEDHSKVGYLLEKRTIDIPVLIENLGDSATRRVWCGIYPRSQVNSWHGGSNLFSIVREIPNCQAGESNIDTRSINFANNEKKVITFRVKAPEVDDTEYSLFGIHCQIDERCWSSQTPDPGVKAWDIHAINIKDSLLDRPQAPTCRDKTFDPGVPLYETDQDCGGTCPPCAIANLCKTFKDCEDGIKCGKEVDNQNRCYLPEKEDDDNGNGDDDVCKTNCGDDVQDKGETCECCPGDMVDPNCKEPFPVDIATFLYLGIGALIVIVLGFGLFKRKRR